MKNIHPEFHYQARELGFQVSDTLGDPPDRKRYERVIESLLGEYAKGNGIEDVNLLSFALADHLVFGDAKVLLAEAAQYEAGNAEQVMKLVSCTTATAGDALAALYESNPELTRKAVITAFLYKNPMSWKEEDHSLDALQEEEDKENDLENEDDASDLHGENIKHLFDTRGEGND